METPRFQKKRSPASVVVGLAVALLPQPASADPIPFAGSVSATIPASPAGDMDLTLTVNGQDHDFSEVDDSLGGTLTLAWVGTQEAPRATAIGCPGGADGGQVRIEEATPGAVVWASWVSPTSQMVIGPVEIPSRPGTASAAVCVAGEPTPEEPGEDPDDDPIERVTRGCGVGQGGGNGHGNGHGGNGGSNGQGGSNGNGNGNGNGGSHGNPHC